jgi:phenylacetate-CoA ligase
MKNLLYQAYLMAGDCDQLTVLNFLKRVESLSEGQIQKLQEERIRALLRHAYTNVPYYRKQIERLGGFQAIETGDVKTFLSELPLLTKTTIREFWEDLKSQDLKSREWFYNTSGGSTGEPVRLIQDYVFREHVRAVKAFYDLWTGYRAGMPKIVLWGSERDLFLGRERLRTRLGRWLRNEYWLNAFRMGPSEMRECLRLINTVRPVQILAYAEAAYELARFAEREGLKVYPPRAVMTSAGTLYTYMRETIQRVFNAPVFNRYGSREVGDIACECEAHKGLHVCPVMNYVEILREDGTPAAPGEVGEVVVTSLTNYAMPLIRYRIGDMAVWAEEKCSCGRAWPLLKTVIGRVSDTFITRDGTRVHGEYFTHLIYFRDWIQKFQFIQENYDLVTLLVVPSCEFEKAKQIVEHDYQDLLHKIQIVMGRSCRLEIKLVEDIPPSPSGKYRYTISKVAKND